MTSKAYGLLLWLLLALFGFRVGAQLVQSRVELSWLPPFEAWHSSVLPYPMLLLAQAAIVGFYGWVALAFIRGRVTPSRTSARLWLTVGWLYFGAMLLRLALGLTVLSSHGWFGSHLPTVFHLVLASFMIVAGTFHLRSVEAT